MSANVKRGFTRVLLADPLMCDEFNAHMYARGQEAKSAPSAAQPVNVQGVPNPQGVNANFAHGGNNNATGGVTNAGGGGNTTAHHAVGGNPNGNKRTRFVGNVVVLPSIPLLNYSSCAPPALPVALDGELPHIMLAVGCEEQDNVVVMLSALVGTGAGCSCGWYPYIKSCIARNPKMLVKVYTCKNGEYSPITMHGIVNEVEDGPNTSLSTTQLPVAFEIRTCYYTRNGGAIHIMIGTGMNVSVNLIISNSWLKKMKGVIDYGTNEVRVPLRDDVEVFPIQYMHPRKSCPVQNGNFTHTP